MFPQDSIDGVSFAYTFDDPKAEGRLLTQYFEILGCRGIYHEGWMASAFGPRAPWVTALPPGIQEWTPDKDIVGALQSGRGLEPSQRSRVEDA